MHIIANLCKKLALCSFSFVCLLSCGIDVVYYIDYIRPTIPTNVESRVQLRSSSDEGYSNYFTEFIIFYRIYTSGQITSDGIREEDTEASGTQYFINSRLRDDIAAFRRYTDYASTTISTSNLENTFTNNDRRYYRLALEGVNISSILGRGSLGKELIISVPPNSMPTLTLRDTTTDDETQYVLFRGDSNLIQPLPSNRYFLNHQDLYNSANAQNANVNPDVATNSSTNPEIRYTYVCLYIAAKGQEFITPIYSQPTYLGVFRLPESSNVL